MKKIFLWVFSGLSYLLLNYCYATSAFASVESYPATSSKISVGAFTTAKPFQRHLFPEQLSAPQPTSCITPLFTKSGNIYWYNISLKLTNNCGRDVDVQNASVTFLSGDNLNTNFWGNFGVVSYPDNTLTITSQPQSAGNYIASLYFHIPETAWANSILPQGQSITLSYGASSASYDPASVNVYLNGTPAQTGQISLSNATSQPSSLPQTYASVDLIFNGQVINKIQVPWSGAVQVPNLSPGSYTLQPETLSDSQGNTYQGVANPSSLTVTANQTAASTVSYTQIMKYGSMNIQTDALPAVISGYTGSPNITFTRSDTGATYAQTVPWNATTAVTKLDNNVTYNLSTASISYNGHRCTGSFNPASLASSSSNPKTSHLTYNCMAVSQDQIQINLTGLPTSTTSVNINFQPSDGSTPISKTVTVSGGTGSDTVMLTNGVIYSVSSTNVPGYTALFQPQPLTAAAGVTETINYTQQQPGRLIAYVVGWKTPPSASSLAAAGYTHVLAAFGVFSTSSPGQIVNAFDTITKDYINSLHAAGIKVSLSLGGALTSIPNTSVDFHQVLSMASNPTTFQNTFVNSLENLMDLYGFDGVDIDIEHGLTGTGNFSSPTGDIAALANIINKLHSDRPNLLISLAPQVANISATSGFNNIWGNYSSLVMQTYQSLSWVGVQVYNTGCAYGLDLICYADNANSPDLSVAMAADLLENWPSKTKTGQVTGFQPYISYLDPSQVVLGYPAPDASGNSDGSPAKPTSVIKRAVQCLRTGVIGSKSCDTYVPPHLYPNIGGVFEWEATYDANNSFKFATDLKSCVLSGNCS